MRAGSELASFTFHIANYSKVHNVSLLIQNIVNNKPTAKSYCKIPSLFLLYKLIQIYITRLTQ